MPCAAPTNRLGSPNNPQGGQGRVRRIGDPGARGPGRAQRRDHLLVDPLPRGKDRYAGWVWRHQLGTDPPDRLGCRDDRMPSEEGLPRGEDLLRLPGPDQLRRDRTRGAAMALDSPSEQVGEPEHVLGPVGQGDHGDDGVPVGQLGVYKRQALARALVTDPEPEGFSHPSVRPGSGGFLAGPLGPRRSLAPHQGRQDVVEDHLAGCLLYTSRCV